LMGLHLRFPACYAEAAMDTPDRNQRFRLCRSPKRTPARPAWQVWCHKWKAVGRVKMNPASAGSSSSYKDNSLFPIRIEGNARGNARSAEFHVPETLRQLLIQEENRGMRTRLLSLIGVAASLPRQVAA
ncbi:MAG: hypothetical protein ACRD1J_05620, partial [Terriglobia bacterium]